MPIRPVDFFSIPNRSQEASQLHHDSIQRNQQAQSQLNTMFNNDIKQNSEKTVKTEKSEYKEFRYDAKDDSKNSYQSKSGNKKEKKKEEPEKLENGSTFDIRI